MNQHLTQRAADLFAQFHTATLATCGQAGPQASHIEYQVQASGLYLFVAHTSDHLFNLKTQPNLVLLSPGWVLHGRGIITQQDISVAPPHPWQAVVIVQPARLHILAADQTSYAETIDFEDYQEKD